MKPWRRHLRRLRLAFTVMVATLIIAAAVLVGLAQVFLPWVNSHPERVATFLSERLNRPVSIDTVQAQWEGAGPVLRLSGVHIAGATREQPSLVIPQAELVLDFSAWAKANRRWNEFRLRGLDLRIEHAADGQWHVAGFAGDSGGDSEGDSPLLMLGALVVADTRISIVDPARGVDLKLKADELRLLNWGSEHTLLGLVRCERDVIEPVQLVARWDGADERGELYVGSEHADLGQVFAGWDLHGARLERGNGRLRLWATFGAQQIDSVHANFDFADVVVRSADTTLMELPGFGQLPRLAGVARWRRDGDGWNLDIAQLTTQPDTRSKLGIVAARPPPTALHLAAKADGEATRYEFSAPELDLATIARLASVIEPLPAGLRRWLFEAAPTGHVRAASAQYASMDDYSVSADLADLHMEAGSKKPGLDALSAHIVGDAQALLLHIPDQATTLRFPYKFRQPLVFSHFGGDVVMYRDEAAWNLATDGLAIEGAGFGFEVGGRVELQDDGSKPLLDLAAVITHADVPAAKLFWPLRDIGENTMRWLDRALIAGQIASGRAVVRGDLDDWPFLHNEGRFDAVAFIEDLTLDYHPEWPRAEGVDAVAQFNALGMRVVGNSGRVLGATVSSVTADIASFKDPVLELDASGSGTGAQLLGFLNAAPVGKRNAEHLKPVKVGGKGDISFHLTQPLKPGDNHSQLQGKVKLTDADLEDTRYKIHFERANGDVSFSEKGFLAGPLDVGYAGHPAKFSLAVGQTVRDEQHQLEATIDADLPLSTLFADVPALQPLWPYFPGAAPWHVALSVDDATSDGHVATRLHLNSELAGTQILLPAPMAKDAAATLPTTIDVPLPFDGSELQLAMGDVLRLRAHLPDAKQPLAIGIAFGTQPPAQLPVSGIAVTGHATLIDIPGWTMLSTGGDQGLPLRSVDIRATEARVGERAFHDLGLRFDMQPEATVLVLSGEQAQGTLRIPRGAALPQQGITAELERLHWPEGPPDEAEDAPGALGSVVPSALPPLHVHVADLHFGSASYGEMKLEAAPTAQGLHFSEVTTTSPNVQMRAQGDWIGSALSSRSEFTIDLGAQNLGNMLAALGYGGVVDGGETSTHIQASWQGGPSNFALWRLNGTLKLSVKDGRIPEVDPRMGRLFGLISLREIPRRLALDFGDFFRSGFTFKSIDGEFQLRDNSAFTTNLHIDSPSADIRISGRTGLKAKDYDQQMTVVPHVSGTLPVVGAVVGGPAGAAAGLAVQTLFSKVINQATTSRYRITGTWENPVSTLISREGARSQARKPVPPPAKEKAG